MITIIVLLILAGVAIASLTGENGLLERARTANESSRGGRVLEEIRIWKMDLLSSQYINDSTESQEQLLNRLENSDLLTNDEKQSLLAGDTITIGMIEITLNDDLQKLRSYFINKEYSDFFDNSRNVYKNLEPILDAEESIIFRFFLHEDGYNFDAIEYNNIIYIITFDSLGNTVINVEKQEEAYMYIQSPGQAELIDLRTGRMQPFIDEAYIVYNGERMDISGAITHHNDDYFISGESLYNSYSIPEGTYTCIIVKDGEEYSGEIVINTEYFG